jgi:heat shock protein HslJ
LTDLEKIKSNNKILLRSKLLKRENEMKIRLTVLGSIILIGFLLVSCMKKEIADTTSDAISIEGIRWYLVEVGGAPVSPMADDTQPHIMLNPGQKRVMGFAGCNTFFGGYVRDGSSLKFGPVGATRMACPDLQTSLETEVFKALDQTRSWKIQDGELLFLSDSDVLAQLTQEKIQGVAGPVWQWMQILYSDDRKVVPAKPENYTVQFREDGTLSVKADCNQKGGTYSLSTQERRISIEITHSTMAACPDGSLEDEFVRGLSAAAIYFIKDGDLYIDLKYDSGTMRFSKQQRK